MLHSSRSSDAGGVSALRRLRDGALTLRVAGLLQAGERDSAVHDVLGVADLVTASAVALNRLGDEIHDAAARIEATLALGATATEAIRPVARRSLRSGMIPLIDSTKTTGLIFFPGTMVGALLAGASPVDAVRLQLVLLYRSRSIESRWRRSSGRQSL
jgi:hypothetical protein